MLTFSSLPCSVRRRLQMVFSRLRVAGGETPVTGELVSGAPAATYLVRDRHPVSDLVCPKGFKKISKCISLGNPVKPGGKFLFSYSF